MKWQAVVQKIEASGCSQSIARLAAGTKLTRQAVTRHLRVLQGAGVVHAAKAGREGRLALDPVPLVGAHAYLEQVSRPWNDVLARLKRSVE